MNSRFYLSLIFFLLSHTLNALAVPSVVVSIKPIHSIVSSLMQSVGEPQLLLENNNSAHNFHIRPSQVKALENAELIISINSKFEAGLANILSNYSNSTRIVISELNLPSIYTLRENDHQDKEIEYDYHLWLDINNARSIAKQLSYRLIEIDATNASTYSSNFDKLDAKLLQLNKDNSEQLAGLEATNFANYSDTLQYFEKNHNLKQPIIVTPYHGARLSIRDVLNAKKKMQKQQTKCLFHTNEINFEKTNVITEDTSIIRAEISILGNEFESGPDQYFNLMTNLTSQIAQCLQ